MIRIGTRKSKLALIQTELVKTQILKYFPNEKIEIVHVVTHGDKVLDKPLGEIGGKGVFTKEIEEKLLDKTIDIAVHSAKDVPMELADGLCLGAVLLRDDNRDVILKSRQYHRNKQLEERNPDKADFPGCYDKITEGQCRNKDR